MVQHRIVELGALALLGVTLSGCGSVEQDPIITTSGPPRSCSGPIVDLAMGYFRVDRPEDLIVSQLKKVQDLCGNSSCPTIALPGCDAQSIDDVQCEVENAFNTSVKFGADEVCAACSDWPCKVCRAACSGKQPSCFEKCEQCEAMFDNCKRVCQSKLTRSVSADFGRLSGAISSANLTGVDLKCSGDGISRPLEFSAELEVHFGGMNADLELHTSTDDESSSYPLSLNRIQLSVAVPIQGSVHCDFSGAGSVDIAVGEVNVSAFDFDADSMQTQLDAVGGAVCTTVPMCAGVAKDLILKAVSKVTSAAINAAVKSELPAQLGRALKPMLQGIFNGSTCAMFNPMNHTMTV